MSRGRTVSRAFKRELMHQLVSGARRPAQLCRAHGLAASLLSRWRREDAERGEAACGPSVVSGEQALAQRVADLERFCGQLALENAVLKKGLSLAASQSAGR